jgi:tetratricopeptide (TPR) repeat protein
VVTDRDTLHRFHECRLWNGLDGFERLNRLNQINCTPASPEQSQPRRAEERRGLFSAGDRKGSRERPGLRRFGEQLRDLGIFSYLQSKEALPKAKATALKALEIDGSLAEARAALGVAKYVYDWDWSGAEAELRRAIELNPSSVDAHGTYAQYLTARGRIDEGFAEDQRTLELDPLSPQVIGTMAYHSLAARQYDDSIAQYKKAMELDPGLE